jgi:hypothetical protein
MSIPDPSSQPRFGYWQHRKGQFYEILGFALEEATLRQVVVYQRVGGEGHQIWTRPVTEFFDGRFKQVQKQDG